MNEDHRAFDDHFRLYMLKFGGQPPVKVVEAWLFKHRKIRKNTFSKALKGNPVPEKFFPAFLSMLLEPHDSRQGMDHLKHTRSVFADYLRLHGIQSLPQASSDALLAHIATPRVPKRTARSVIKDVLSGTFWSAAAAFSPGQTLRDVVQACSENADGDVNRAIEWMYVCCGRSVHGDGRALTYAAAITAAQEHIRMSLKDYQARAAEWLQFNPWTIVFARDHHTRVSMSIMLPISDDAYARLLAGDLTTYDVRYQDLQRPSPNLLLEALAESPDVPVVSDSSEAVAMRLALGVQTAVAPRFHLCPRPSLRILAIAGTPKNQSLLSENGFKHIGRTMARTGVEFWQREVPLNPLGPREILEASYLRSLSLQFNGEPPQ